MRLVKLYFAAIATVAILTVTRIVHLSTTGVKQETSATASRRLYSDEIYELLPRLNKMFLGHTVNATSTKTAEKPKYHLTIFTTFKEINPNPYHEFARKLVLENWSHLKPYVRPVVFLNFTNSSLANSARAAGWDVLQTVRTNKLGAPFLKDMFRTVFDMYNDSILYGFANGDLLFDNGIIRTLEAVIEALDPLNNNIMVTGRRTDVPVNLSIGGIEKDFEVNNLRQLAVRKGELKIAWAVDYFFFTKEGCSLNWSTIVDVVIGRLAYDTYLVAMAKRQNVNVIDCTKTLLAVHISEKGVPSHGRNYADSYFNIQLIGKNFSHTEGYPTSSKLATDTDIVGKVFIVQR